MRGLLFLSILFSLTANSFESAEQPSKPTSTWEISLEQGWFWGERQRLEEERKREMERKKLSEVMADDEPKEKDCTNPDEWTVDCGFVSPERDFDFSQVQYNALTRQLAMYPDDTEKVKQYQRFVWWAVDQAMTAARTARWNMIQDQELNPFINNPVSTFGIRAATSELATQRQSLYEDIAQQGGVMVVFTRHDCVYCHKSIDTIRHVGTQTGLPLYNAALDDICLSGFDDDFCYTGDLITRAAKGLKVAVVPDLWLYLPQDNGWIRLSSGLESADVIESRISIFFGAAKRAAKKGIVRAATDTRPAVDFTERSFDENVSEGVGVAPGIPQGRRNP